MRLWLIAVPAMAAASAALADVTTGANGGTVRAAGEYRYELVVKPHRDVRETAMVIFVTDRTGNPVATAGARGRIEFSSGELKGVATLHPDGANRMKGYGLMSAKPDLRLMVTITVPGKPEYQALFVPYQANTSQER